MSESKLLTFALDHFRKTIDIQNAKLEEAIDKNLKIMEKHRMPPGKSETVKTVREIIETMKESIDECDNAFKKSMREFYDDPRIHAIRSGKTTEGSRG